MLSAPQPSHRKQAIRLVKTACPTLGSMGSLRVPDSGTGVMFAGTPQLQRVLLAADESLIFPASHGLLVERARWTGHIEPC
jgi:hypothetical protein